MFKRSFCFRDDEQARCVAVQSVNDTRAHARRVWKLLKVMCEGVRECARMYARGGMDHEPGGFVDDYERLVFVDDFDRYRFRREARVQRAYQFDFEFVMFAEFVRRLAEFAVDEQRLRLRSDVAIARGSNRRSVTRERHRAARQHHPVRFFEREALVIGTVSHSCVQTLS